jgi:hypothetical protein
LTARIDVAHGAEGACLRVAGRLEGSAAQELLEVCRRQRGVLFIDLEELLSLDHTSVETLQELRAAGARIVGASPYIAMLLNGRPDSPVAAMDSEKEEE